MITVIAGKAKAGMAHSDCGWTCGCAGKTEIPWEHVPYLSAYAVVHDSRRRGAISSVWTFTFTSVVLSILGSEGQGLGHRFASLRISGLSTNPRWRAIPRLVHNVRNFAFRVGVDLHLHRVHFFPVFSLTINFIAINIDVLKDNLVLVALLIQSQRN